MYMPADNEIAFNRFCVCRTLVWKYVKWFKNNKKVFLDTIKLDPLSLCYYYSTVHDSLWQLKIKLLCCDKKKGLRHNPNQNYSCECNHNNKISSSKIPIPKVSIICIFRTRNIIIFNALFWNKYKYCHFHFIWSSDSFTQSC